MTLIQTIVKQADELVRIAEMPISQWVEEQKEKQARERGEIDDKYAFGE